MLEYYRLLRSLRRIEALARCFLIRCKCCRIYFLTHWRNRCQLEKVRCPFGCREEDDRRRSTQRSLAHYRQHPDEKRRQNQNRYRVVPSSSARPAPCTPEDRGKEDSPEPPAQQPQPDESGCGGADQDPLPECPPELAQALPKAQDLHLMKEALVIVSLIEGRRVILQEIWQALLQFWRQRPMSSRRKIDHTIAWLNAQPP